VDGLKTLTNADSQFPYLVYTESVFALKVLFQGLTRIEGDDGVEDEFTLRDFVNGQDIWMLDGCSSATFCQEARSGFGVQEQEWFEDSHSHLSQQLKVRARKDETTRSFADQLFKTILSQLP
jgi:hypothetical protein